MDDTSADAIDSLLKRLGVPEDESLPLINKIRSDGRKSYIASAKGLGIAHHRVILRDPINSVKLLLWTHRLIANAKAVFYGPHPEVPSKYSQHYLAPGLLPF